MAAAVGEEITRHRDNKGKGYGEQKGEMRSKESGMEGWSGLRRKRVRVVMARL